MGWGVGPVGEGGEGGGGVWIHDYEVCGIDGDVGVRSAGAGVEC